MNEDKFTHYTRKVFQWVMAGIFFNLALYALGVTGISFATLIGSIVALYIPCYIIVGTIVKELSEKPKKPTKTEDKSDDKA